ncbi:aldo/keto reductase [candidate division MSBL1 archaeon SCGC-AAA259O05]|uniref:Aldo/keto reductase n=1 Tax=candidate division MSBL1 archaeon SCGC-AAA259O05 TaxID=1698271 RepID=A0A133V3P5_9EURY|nr:aldo/keto reductase [candidate division MSBL1 archaeon SCGC-AAA259O05]
MKYRTFGKTNWKVSEVGLGTWALGGSWGKVSKSDAFEVLHEAIDRGVNFFDTADVYGDGRSEKLIGQILEEREEKIYVASKFGRRLDPHVASGYTKDNLEKFLNRSLENLGVDTIDLMQLHCPPTDVYYNPKVFEALEDFVEEGKIQHYGVSVEKVEEGLKAIEYPNLTSVQIIFNIFRQRPKELFFKRCEEKDVAVITRVPLASRLLTGKMTPETEFPENDHRNFNREGEAFDVGETFAGVDFETGLKAVEELKKILPENMSCAQLALKWILMHEEVSCVIPGAKKVWQVKDNTAASELPDLEPELMKKIENIYEDYIKPQVHHKW